MAVRSRFEMGGCEGSFSCGVGAGGTWGVRGGWVCAR